MEWKYQPNRLLPDTIPGANIIGGKASETNNMRAFERQQGLRVLGGSSESPQTRRDEGKTLREHSRQIKILGSKEHLENLAKIITVQNYKRTKT